ncbi:MAG: DUF4282 domain-containing protein [Thiopseudomonas sp.]|nr:DUF4282 domain-containing protein [Thiopseudomonas sp.]MCK9465728.1 DUF4282 domain-containing protein [Thiopseudomonas sp.]
MKDVLFFENMLTPKIITVVYWFLLLAVVVGGVSTMFAGYGFSFTNVLLGLVYIVGGGIGVRIWCELLIVLFKMNEALQAMRNK